MNEITLLLSAAGDGDPHAAERLLPLVYGELRELAAQRLAREKPRPNDCGDFLVHEAYTRLVDGNQAQNWTGRGHFFAAAAEVDAPYPGRSGPPPKAIKHGGGTRREDLNETAIAAAEPAEDVLAVNDALELLAAVHPQAAQLVTLRFFGGLNMTEAAEALDMSVRRRTSCGPMPDHGCATKCARADGRNFFDWRGAMNECTIFAGALEKRDPATRLAYLAQACGDDAVLRARIETLLRKNERLGDFLEAPAGDLAALNLARDVAAGWPIVPRARRLSHPARDRSRRYGDCLRGRATFS